MARNKYPEETVQKILDIAFRLFVSKGYEKTSIQDIVDELGMSKGAIYHHFKSKEDILDSLTTRYYSQFDWYKSILADASLNGLQKLKKIFFKQLSVDEKIQMDALTTPMIYNSRLILEAIQNDVRETAPVVTMLLEEGNRDGSLHTDFPKEAAEVLLLLVNVWINPALFPVEKEHFLRKVRFYQQILYHMGIPLMDKELLEVSGRYYDRFHLYSAQPREAPAMERAQGRGEQDAARGE